MEVYLKLQVKRLWKKNVVMFIFVCSENVKPTRIWKAWSFLLLLSEIRVTVINHIVFKHVITCRSSLKYKNHYTFITCLWEKLFLIIILHFLSGCLIGIHISLYSIFDTKNYIDNLDLDPEANKCSYQYFTKIILIKKSLTSLYINYD